MGLVIYYNDVFLVAQLTANTAHHLVWRFGKWIVSIVLFKQLLGQLARRHTFSQLECMEVRNDEFGFIQFREQIRWNDVVLFVVILWIVGEEKEKKVLDRE